MSRPSPKSFRTAAWASLAAVVVVVAVAKSRSDTTTSAASRVRQLELVHAERFRTEQPFRHVWRRDQPLVDRGWLLVLAGDPAEMGARQNKEPVLYVGAQTADRVNTGQDSGRLVVIVPGDFALADAPVFYGPAELPEELLQRHIDGALATARNEGAVPPSAEAIAKATAGAVERSFATDYELRRRAIDLVEAHSPTEQDLIAGWRVPLVR